MKKTLSLVTLSFSVLALATISHRLIAQNPADQAVTRPDHLILGDWGTCNEGETDYNLTRHVARRCGGNTGTANTWTDVLQLNLGAVGSSIVAGSTLPAYQALLTDTNVTPNSTTGITGQRIAHATYKFSVDGGAISAITPAANVTIPINAVITNVAVNSTTAFVGSTATIAIGTTAGSSATSLVTVAGGPVANYTLNGFVQGVPVPQTASTWVKMSAAGQIQLTVATAPLTAGQAEVYVWYYLSSS
jgi:hypothetical protein